MRDATSPFASSDLLEELFFDLISFWAHLNDVYWESRRCLKPGVPNVRRLAYERDSQTFQLPLCCLT